MHFFKKGFFPFRIERCNQLDAIFHSAATLAAVSPSSMRLASRNLNGIRMLKCQHNSPRRLPPLKNRQCLIDIIEGEGFGNAGFDPAFFDQPNRFH